MNITDYLTGSAQAAQRLRVEAEIAPLREGYSRTQTLVDHIAESGPISTVDLCRALDLTSRQVWGLLKQPRDTGKVAYEHGMWARTGHEIASWQADIDAAPEAKP